MTEDWIPLEAMYQEIREIYQASNRDWIVAYSGGKDSTATLQLIWYALSTLPPEQRRHHVFVIANDTLVELDILTWAIRKEHGIYFKEGHLPSHPDKARRKEAERAETAVLWEAITANERFLSRLKRMSQAWQSNIRQGAQELRIYFHLHLPLLVIRPLTTSFLMLELLLFSLQQVDWGEIAASLSGVPYVAGSVQPENIQEGAVLIATMKALIWQSSITFGEFSQKAEFSAQLRQLCLELADRCCQTHRQIRALEDSGTV